MKGNKSDSHLSFNWSLSGSLLNFFSREHLNGFKIKTSYQHVRKIFNEIFLKLLYNFYQRTQRANVFLINKFLHMKEMLCCPNIIKTIPDKKTLMPIYFNFDHDYQHNINGRNKQERILRVVLRFIFFYRIGSRDSWRVHNSMNQGAGFAKSSSGCQRGFEILF